MIEIYLQDLPGTVTIKCDGVKEIEAVKQLYLDAIANDIHMRDFCLDNKQNETADVYQKRMSDRINTLNVINRCMVDYMERVEGIK